MKKHPPRTHNASSLLVCLCIILVSATVGWRSAGAAAPIIAPVGVGFSDVSPHQVVRTNTDLLYAIVPDCPGGYPCGQSFASIPNHLHAYKGTQPGNATSFAEMDAVHAPTGGIGSSAIAVDGANVIHVLWIDVLGGRVSYTTFDPATDTWNLSPVLLAPVTGWVGSSWDSTLEGVALAVDAQGVPHVVYASKAGGATLHLWYQNKIGGAWSFPLQLDDVPLGANVIPQHPAVAFTAQGDFVIAYMTGTFNYTADGTVYLRTRSAAGTWAASVPIPDQAMTTIDNGPSLLITPDGTQHLTFVSGVTGHEDEIRYWYNAGGGWQGDSPPPQQTHNPSLGPDGNGGIYLYGHGTPIPRYDGEGANLYTFHKPAGGTWEPWTLYATGSYDSSVSTRWAQFFQFFPQTLDIIFWQDLPGPYALFAGSTVIPATPPTVTVTAPTSSATVSGVVTVTATAAANLGVASVQFSLDGNPLGPAVTRTPYTTTWDTITTSDGSHTLAAQVTDTVGNTAASAPVTVTVANINATTLTLLSLSETAGPTAGGAKVILTGTGFTVGATVQFGTSPATVLSATNTTLTVQTPAGTGRVTVTVTVGTQSVAKIGAYIYGTVNPIGVVRPTAPPTATVPSNSAGRERPIAPPIGNTTPNALPPRR